MADGKNLTASQVLTHFLFPPAKQYGMVNKLSGGEKKRLQLMRVLMKNPNYLILDEPTNDLDIDTLNVLEDFLLNFPGILMLVSHDRYLIDRLTDQLFIFEGDGNVQIYSGNYTDYRLEQEEPKKPIKADTKNTAKETGSEVAKRKLSFKEEKERSELEMSIKKLEEQAELLTAELNSGITDHNKLSLIATNIKEVNDMIEEQTFRWLELSE
jgi:ATP-binding cassette subfamily F protein uup